MVVAKFHPLEKTANQARQAISRLEVHLDNARTDEEREITKNVLNLMYRIRDTIPEEFKDSDLKEVD